MNIILKRQSIHLKPDNYVNDIFEAAKDRKVNSVQYFLSHKVNFNQVDKEQSQTPLYYACEEVQLDIEKLLISKGASLDIEDNEQETPLDLASKNGHLLIVQYLVENGSNIHRECKKNRTPLHLTCQ